VTEKRSLRKDLCKKCFWFSVLLKILEECPSFTNKDSFYHLVHALPANNEAIASEPNATLQAWLEQVPQEKRAVGSDDKFNHEWYGLLQHVKPNLKEEKEKASSVSEAETGVEDAEVRATKKLFELRKVKREAAKKSSVSLKHMYHDSFFFKLLGLIDFYTSLAQVSPAALSFV